MSFQSDILAPFLSVAHSTAEEEKAAQHHAVSAADRQPVGKRFLLHAAAAERAPETVGVLLLSRYQLQQVRLPYRVLKLGYFLKVAFKALGVQMTHRYPACQDV